MKTFKKKHDYLPSGRTVERLLRYHDPSEYQMRRYRNWLIAHPSMIPLSIREATLARPDPNKRTNIQYFSDLRSFLMYDEPNRSLPVEKFLDMFRGLVPQEELDAVKQSMTGFTLKISKEPEAWIEVYEDENVHSCMSPSGEVARNSKLPACYAHPENHLAIAALYPPGGGHLIARTIVNTEEKWYVRLFGDPLLVEKLQNLGYRRMSKPAREFKMYGLILEDEDGLCNYNPLHIRLPYFDFVGHNGGKLHKWPIPETFNPTTGFVEVIINAGVQ